MIQRTPYVLASPVFRFRALTAAAERLPLGGDREVALATFVAARLVADALAAPAADRAIHRARAAAARQWFTANPLPAPARAAFQQLAEALQRSDPELLASSWERVVAVASKVVDPHARAELRAIAIRPPPREGPET